MENKLLFLSRQDVIDLGATDMSFVANLVKQGFEGFYGEKVRLPHKTTLKPITDGNETTAGLVNFLPSYLKLSKGEIFSCKALGAMPSNSLEGIPRANGLLLLFDPVSKRPICVMDASVISAMRTGAVTALAAPIIANIPKTVGLVGAGTNMKTQLMGIMHAFGQDFKVQVYSRGDSKYRFVNSMKSKYDIEITAMSTLDETVANADLIITCVANTTVPLIRENRLLRNGVTIFNIGCYETDVSVIRNLDRWIVDLWSHSFSRCAQSVPIAVRDGHLSPENIEEITPMIVGQQPGRKSTEEKIIFCPVGLGFEDAVVADSIYHRALSASIGTEIMMDDCSEWL